MALRQRRKKTGGGGISSNKDTIDEVEAAEEAWRVFSSNPEKAWCEKFFLMYSVVWPAVFGLFGFAQYHAYYGDVGNLLFTLFLATPNLLVPFLYCPTDRKWYETYWFKFSVWIWIFGFIASYFFTEYFFDVLGMIYNFPNLKWNLDSVLLGRGKQVVPIIMYVHAWYFFMTYHTCSIIFMRIIRTAPGFRKIPVLSSLFSVGLAAWVFALGEIWSTTMEAIKNEFTYQDMHWAKTQGAACYSLYFLVSFPMSYYMDETRKDIWTMRRTVENSLAAGMLAFLLLDVVSQFVITDWQHMNF